MLQGLVSLDIQENKDACFTAAQAGSMANWVTSSEECQRITVKLHLLRPSRLEGESVRNGQAAQEVSETICRPRTAGIHPVFFCFKFILFPHGQRLPKDTPSFNKGSINAASGPSDWLCLGIHWRTHTEIVEQTDRKLQSQA